MRLWHKNLISVLPRQQLMGQWRECCLIAKLLHENGTPNHLLVNKVTNYPIEHFIAYCMLVSDEMSQRGYKADFSKIDDLFDIDDTGVTHEKLFSNWHNDRYFVQCYYNLQEKYDCGGISEKEWDNIRTLYFEIMDGDK